MKKLLLILSVLMLNSNLAMAANNFLDANWWKSATLDSVKAEITKGTDVNALGNDKNDQGELRTNVTPLMFALKYGDPSIDIIKTLIKAGADVNAKNNNGATALMYINSNTNLEIVKTLIKAGADVNAKNNDGGTALMYIDSNTNLEIVKTLIKAGADVNAKNNNGGTALMAAAATSNPEIIKELLKAGADVNAKGDNGWTVLMAAAISTSNPEIIKELLKAGADKDISTSVMYSKNNPMVTTTILQAVDWHAYCKFAYQNSLDIYACEDRMKIYVSKENLLPNCGQDIGFMAYIPTMGKGLGIQLQNNELDRASRTAMAIADMAAQRNCSVSQFFYELTHE